MNTADFFTLNADRKLSELDLTVEELYAYFKARLALEEQLRFEASWPTVGTQP